MGEPRVTGLVERSVSCCLCQAGKIEMCQCQWGECQCSGCRPSGPDLRRPRTISTLRPSARQARCLCSGSRATCGCPRTCRWRTRRRRRGRGGRRTKVTGGGWGGNDAARQPACASSGCVTPWLPDPSWFKLSRGAQCLLFGTNRHYLTL